MTPPTAALPLCRLCKSVPNEITDRGDEHSVWVACSNSSCTIYAAGMTHEQWDLLCAPAVQATADADIWDVADEIVESFIYSIHGATDQTRIDFRKSIVASIRKAVSPKATPTDDVSYSRSYALQLCELVTASENLLDTCEVDFFARRDGTADAVVRKDYWNKWVSAVRALKAPTTLKAAQEEIAHKCSPNNTWSCNCGLTHIVNPPHPGGEM